jgi:hypothetical protein
MERVELLGQVEHLEQVDWMELSSEVVERLEHQERVALVERLEHQELLEQAERVV